MTRQERSPTVMSGGAAGEAGSGRKPSTRLYPTTESPKSQAPNSEEAGSALIGAVTILLRLNRPPEVRLTALTEQDERALQPLAAVARRLVAGLVEVRT